nr:hypothetical protein [Niallia nealsonii]
MLDVKEKVRFFREKIALYLQQENIVLTEEEKTILKLLILD